MINTRYEILKKLGVGRSSVYLCHDIEAPEAKYAIKILPPTADHYEKEIFIKEYFTLQRLEHPNIIKAYDLGAVFKTDNEEGIEPGSTYIVLEYFDGKELLSSDVIHNETILKEIVKQICAALYYLHQSKYIYYDLKPDNILVSLKGSIPQLRLIDLGLAGYSPSPSDYEIKGTAHYIAPELLKKEKHNHSVDFYSLGMIIYQIIYNKLPFNAKVELDIYKSAIEDEFEFPPAPSFSQELINVVKKLLEKDVHQRYSSALAVIKELGFPLSMEMGKEFLPAKIFSCRDSIIKQLSTYIKDQDSTEVFTIKGFEGVGKSSLLNKIHELYRQAILVSDIRGKSVEELIRYLLRQIIFSESVYPKLSEKDKLALLQQVDISPKEIINEFRTSVALISSNCKFILLIDDLNLYDQLVSNLLLDILPILQVNNIKVIVSESSEHEFISAKINNRKELTLGSFTGQELITFLEESYSSDFPRETIKNLIIKNADLILGNIKSFIKDLILFEIMKFSETGVIFSDDEDKLSSITEAHFAVYDLRLAKLSRKELIAAQILSAFDVYVDSHTLSILLDLSKEEIEKIIFNLQFNNITQKFISGQTLIFTSEAIKKYIYASIEDKKKLHHNIARKLTKKLPSFNRLESARQYELADEFETSYKITMEEINDAEKHSTFSYMQRLFSHLVKLPVKKELIDSAKIKLSEVYLKLGDVQSSLNTIKELKSSLPETKIDHKLYFIEGSALIASGEYESGKRVMSDFLNKIKDVDEKNRLKVELAYADFELKMYNEANQQCDNLLNGKNLFPELKGRCYNLKGMINIYQSNDLNSALENFIKAKSQFVESNQPVRIAGAEVNIGNVYNILSNYEKAEEHWQSASHINQSIGNLVQEGMLRQSLGVFYFNRGKYELALESYLKARNIFLSLGNEIGASQNLENLSEVYITLCDYQEAFNSLNKAKVFFERINNYKELSEVLFLLCKLFFGIGTNQMLEETIEKYKENNKKIGLKNISRIHESLLNQMLFIRKSRSVSVDELSVIRYEFYNQRDIYNYIETSFLIIKALIDIKENTEALNQLNNMELIELCSQNSILEAEREYFLGIISKNTKSDKLLAPLVYFEKVYELIKDEYVNELTWKVLFEISELYIERGNLTKAKYFVTYTRELIYFIAEKIESPNLRAAYLRSSERMNTLKKLESFYPSN
jgi:serine/threonine protein kinase